MTQAFIQKMFPTGLVNGRGGMEVNGLEAGTEPQNVTVLYKWNDRFRTKRDTDRRDFYHVTDGYHCGLLRICKAMEGSGYAEFAVIHQVAAHGTDAADDLNDTAARWRGADR